MLDIAEKAGDTRSWPGFLRELREQIKLLAELEGRISSQPQVNVLINNPEWVQIRTEIINALDPYPEAREAVINAISRSQKRSDILAGSGQMVNRYTRVQSGSMAGSGSEI
ncbi:MAG: hypothetical protein N3G75_06240 [Methanothrix sp.]|nr:hypothetical protein [Methanothrix sp.]MCX8207414.1 hypothetical protein [Methanothrix sp.]